MNLNNLIMNIKKNEYILLFYFIIGDTSIINIVKYISICDVLYHVVYARVDAEGEA